MSAQKENITIKAYKGYNCVLDNCIGGVKEAWTVLFELWNHHHHLVETQQ